ncbi:MAG: helix-turn-helix domain-containing protein [Candidatus Micrarchaeota archaeon]|nr:helix-turn-helix domain-containing protein [Candidatus Micrarchaeota archaeon]
MWVLRLKLRHDCTIANRCRKFRCLSYSLSIGNWSEGGYYYTTERHTLEGEPRQVRRFLEDLKKDPKVAGLEIAGNTLFFIGKDRHRIPSSFYNPKIFFTKPVFVDRQGFEYWEVASHEKKVLGEFLDGMKKQGYPHLQILYFRKVLLDNIYFPAIAPGLTEKQKRVFELACENGYYDIPKGTDLAHLAKALKISIATCQEHLKRAEAKIIPKLRGF